MRYAIESNGQLAAAVEVMRIRARNPRPLTLRIGQFLVREARRRAPRGKSARQASLQASLNAYHPDDFTIILRSDKPYAGIQARGGTVLPGTGRLAAKMLVMPLNRDAENILQNLGSGVSLRSLNLTLVRTRKGRLVLIRANDAGKTGRGAGRRHRLFSGQVLFLLLPRSVIRPNPAPAGYVPKLDEPLIRTWIGEQTRKYLTASAGGAS